MFEINDVWKSGSKGQTRNSWILAGASVTFPPGRKIALLGPERERNTSVLRILAGVDDPDRGVIRRMGVACWPFEFSGYVDGDGSLQQNANFIAHVYGVNAEQVARIAATLSGVRIIRGKPLKQYAPSERKAIQLGLTLALQFDWYFVDQKLPEGLAAVGELVDAALADRFQHASVIWATNDPDMLENYCDAGLVLDQGRLTFYNDLGQAVTAYRRSIESEAITADEGRPRLTSKQRRAARRARKDNPQEPG